MCSEARRPAIRLEGIGKAYRIYRRPSHRILEWLRLGGRRHREVWALSGIDLRVPAGTTLGVLGQNGSGKSTLLQILAGILQPTLGISEVNGNVAALLELGTGFNPEFSGRENVFMNSAILGLSKAQTEAKLDRILEFAELGEYIDHPVKTYSSGMFMRLAFAVAVHVEPEVLLIDEALAVGDLVFQHRCIHRMRQLRRQGRTIVFVTHDLQAVTSFCDHAILLDRGRKIGDGPPRDVVRQYRQLVFERESKSVPTLSSSGASGRDRDLPVITTIPYSHHRFGQGGAKILGILLLSSQDEVLNTLRGGETIRLLISVEFKQSISSPIIGFTVRDRLGTEIAASNTAYEGAPLPDVVAGQICTAAFEIKIPNLRPDSYTISPAVSSGTIWEHEVEDWIDNAYVFDLEDTGLIYGTMRWPCRVRFNLVPGTQTKTVS